ncbi:hypothetical protein [Cohnella luojiensis]|uniref:Uncharacterized protein n=1 Tax=Cohnella luojiensis TaxID=652876 RepID=A0A4Y8LP71_9BACL|nr:hypothetical protein [Cohnella luojiensis]TFE19533.1 hypothetical protein E2980_22875 [Cohnella luojiensis]
MYWDAWPIERILILFVSLAFMMIGIQVTMFHYRQNFHHKSMWLPVISAPIFFMIGLVLTFYNVMWLNGLFQVMMWFGVISGLIGFYFHVRGVGVRVGGWALRNFLIGPPVTLPMMYTAISVLGLIAVYWEA